MSIQTELTRITNDRNSIRTKLVALGLATATDNLDTLAAALSAVADRGTPEAEVKEGETYTILEGYYHGGTVAGVKGGGHYELQAKTGIVPTKAQQTITSDEGFYGLSSVQIDAIPDQYQDVSAVTALASEVLANKMYVTADGTLTAGTMPNNGAVTATLNTETTSYTIPAGYHNGSGAVSIVTESKTVTPTKSLQNIDPTSGKVLSRVVVEAIPDNYVDLDDYAETDALAANVLIGKTAYGKDDDEGFFEIEGTMPNNGDQTAVLDKVNSTKTVPLGYASGGTVSVAAESKNVTPSTSEQTIVGTNNKYLTSVVVAAIPDNFVDSTTVDAVAANVLAGKVAVVKTGTNEWTTAAGTMPNNGAISEEIDGLTTTSVTIAAGYTSGGTVSLTSDIEEALALI